MIQVTGQQFDNGAAGGDNKLTQVTQYVDASTSRVTTFLYDWRNRRTDTDGEVDFYEQVCYDNLDRVLRTDRRNTAASGNLIARTMRLLDDRGRVYQSIRYEVDPTTGIIGNALTDNNWFDAAGNLLKSLPAGAQLFAKYVYDGLRRVTTEYRGFNLTDAGYANAGSVSADTILEQIEMGYDAASNTILTTTRLRYHNAAGVGPLGSPTSTQPLAQVMYLANWPDALGRIVASADYGANGGAILSRPNTIPISSDSCLVTITIFDPTGMVQTSIDPLGTATCYSYDAVGREIQRILNCLTASSSSSSSSSSSRGSSSGGAGASGPCPPSDDTNVTVLTAYNGDGNVSGITAVNAETGNQVTQYLYGSALATSGIASSLLKVAEIYPDSVGGSDQVSFAYNRQSEITTPTDQNGTVHSLLYDLLGRRTQDRVIAAGTGVDTTVLRIAAAYEVRGMVSGVTSYDNASVGVGNIVNDVQLVYNAFAQLIADYQAHGGAVNFAATPAVQYGYADGGGNTIRPTTMTYPNGRMLSVNYGITGGMNDALSRVSGFIDNDGVTQLSDYLYLGLSSIIEVDEPQPGLAYTLIGITGGNDPVTGDIYRGLDLFGRVKDLIWTGNGGSSSSSSSSGGTASIVERIQHGYDRAGNRLWRKELADPSASHDELYLYDGLYRIKDMQRGTLNGNDTAVVPMNFSQCWGLDATGNWQNFREDDTGSGVWNLIQARSANPVNEITSVLAITGPAWVSPKYDAAGNMTTLPQPSSPGSSYKAAYDAWNRLMNLCAGGTQVASYQYDGLKRRTLKQTYTMTFAGASLPKAMPFALGAGAGSVVTQIRHYFYSAAWQVLEERVGTSASAERQFVWGQRYIDDVILRDRDAAGGVLTERLYAMQDANFNVTTLAGQTHEKAADFR